MKKAWFLLIAVFVGLMSGGAASAQEIAWTRQFGSSDFDVARAIVVTDTGVYVFGAVGGALPGQTYAGGLNDVFVRKYAFNGNVVWTRQFGTPGLDFPMSGRIAVDDTGLYVAGETDDTLPGQKTNAGVEDVFVRKYDFDGNEVWTRQFGTAGPDFADGIAVKPGKRGGVFVVGGVSGALSDQPYAGEGDAFIRKYDSDGNEVWTRQFGTPGDDHLHAVAVDHTGIYAAGSTTGSLPGFANAGDHDAVVTKYDFDGNEVWTRQFGTNLFDHLGGIALKHGGVYVAGFTHGTLPGQTSAGGRDAVVRKYDTDGNEVWTRQFGTPGSDGGEVFGIAAEGNGVYLASNVGGALPGQSSAGSGDAFVRKYDSKGQEMWTLQFGTTAFDRAQGVAIHETGIYVNGRVGGTLPGQTSAGDQDAFLVRLAVPDD